MVKVHDVAGSVAGTGGRVRYDVGDCEVAVEWFERDESGGEERRVFRAGASAENGQIHTFNSTELRLISSPLPAAGSAIQLEMLPLPPIGGVPLGTVQRDTRISPRLLGQSRPNYRNVVYRVHEVRAESPLQLWEISAGSESAILDHCF